MQNCQDAFSATFTSYNELFGYQQQVSSRSQWSHCAVNQLHLPYFRCDRAPRSAAGPAGPQLVLYLLPLL